MSTNDDRDGGDAVLAFSEMVAGVEPTSLRRAGDGERVGKVVTMFARAVRHVVSGGPTTRGDLAPIVLLSSAERAMSNPDLLAAVLGPALRVVPSTEGETSDLHLPAGDEFPYADQAEDRRAQAHAHRVAAAVWAEDVRKLVEARYAIWLRPTDPAGTTIDAVIARMAARAGVSMPRRAGT